MKDLEKKINDMTNLSESQRTKLLFKEQVYDDLLVFLQSYIKKITTKNCLKERIESTLLEKMDNVPTEDNPDADTLSNVEMIKLLEILSREEVDSTGNMLKAVIESSKAIESANDGNKNQNPNAENSKEKDISQGDINTAITTLKKINKLIDNIEKTELSEGEKK